jgi:hypothetical protein
VSDYVADGAVSNGVGVSGCRTVVLLRRRLFMGSRADFRCSTCRISSCFGSPRARVRSGLSATATRGGRPGRLVRNVTRCSLPRHYGCHHRQPQRILRSRRLRLATVGTDTGQRIGSRHSPQLGSDQVFRFVRPASHPVVAMKSSRMSTTAVGDSTCGKCPTPASTSSRLAGTAS